VGLIQGEASNRGFSLTPHVYRRRYMTGVYRRSLHPGLLVKVGSIQVKGHGGSIQGETPCMIDISYLYRERSPKQLTVNWR